MKKLCIVTTMWSSISNWIKPFLNDYNENGIDVTIVCNMDENYEKQLKSEFPFVHTKSIPFPRGINFWGSIKSIRVLKKFFKQEKFDMVQYSTPNAAFYASIAAKSCRVPVRLYCQWGMLFVSRTGIKRKIFKKLEKIICGNSTNIQPDSFGNLEYCRKEGLYDETKSCVIWNGSAKGLDLSAYDITKKEEFKKEIYEKYSISDNDIVIGFVGRLGREKGCNELILAFQKIKEDYSNAKLLFVGPIEKEETIEPEILEYFNNCDDIIKTGRVTGVEKYMSAMSVFALPSYREGFGMSVIEASAMGVPVVATKYPGPSGGMIDGETGIAVEIKDVESLEKAIRYIISHSDESKEMGVAGRRYVESSFDQKLFKQKYMENRLMLLGLERKS